MGEYLPVTPPIDPTRPVELDARDGSADGVPLAYQCRPDLLAVKRWTFLLPGAVHEDDGSGSARSTGTAPVATTPTVPEVAPAGVSMTTVSVSVR